MKVKGYLIPTNYHGSIIARIVSTRNTRVLTISAGGINFLSANCEEHRNILKSLKSAVKYGDDVQEIIRNGESY